MAARAFPKHARRVAVGVKRVSLLKQVGNYSFDGQGNKFAILAERFDCDIPPELMIEDKGYSGTDFNRPSIKKAKDMIRAGRANSVAFPWLDRFARDVEGGLATIREFRELGAEILLGDLGWYQDSGWYKAQMHMFLTIAQFQRDDIADKSRGGVAAKLARGLAHFGAPYGWHMVTAMEIAARALNAGLPVPAGSPQNFYERVLNDLEVVALMGELALAGGREGSQAGICRELDARGIRTPRGAAEWNTMTVHNIMRDTVYSTGTWFYGKREFVEPKRFRKPDAERHNVRSVGKLRPREEWAGSIEMPGGPIWTPDEHAAILEALVRNGSTSTGKPARPKSEGGREALLKNLCTCGECNSAVLPWRGSRIKADGTRSLFYRCRNRSKTTGRRLCAAKSVSGDLLEEVIYQRTKLAVCYELPDLVAAQYGKIVTAEDEREIAALRGEYNHKRRCLSEARQKGIEARTGDAKEDYANLVAKYSAELALLERRIRAASNESELDQIDAPAIQKQARKAFETKDPAERRTILLDWVQNVRYAKGEAEITICIRRAVNHKSAEHAIYNKQPLVLTVKARLAA